MKKKELLEHIGDLLFLNNVEVECKDFPELHERGTHFHAYAIAYDTESYNCVVVKPWSGADYSWPLDISYITKTRLDELCERVRETVFNI